MKPFGKIKWIVGMGVMSVLALVSNSHAEMMDFREGPSRAAGLVAETTLAQTSASSQQKAYRYQYFSDAQVYFDPSRELYFYMFNGEWTKSPALPREFRNRLGDFVVIETDDDDPHQFYTEGMKPRLGPAESRAREGRSKISGEHAPYLSYRVLLLSPRTGVLRSREQHLFPFAWESLAKISRTSSTDSRAAG